MMLHDSHKAFYRQPMGPAPAGSQVTIRFRCDEATAVILRTWQDEELCYVMINTGDDVWETSVLLPENPGLYWYRFIVYRKDGRTLTYGNQPDQLGGEGKVGFGSDFDGIERKPRGMENPADFPKLIDALRRRGFKEEDVKDIAGLGLLKYYQRIKV